MFSTPRSLGVEPFRHDGDMLLLPGGEQLREATRGGLLDGMRVSQKPFNGGLLL